MTRLAPWNPTTLRRRTPFSRLFDEFVASLEPTGGSEEVANRGWIPAVDIRETDAGFVFEAELPGLTKENVHITLENQVLSIEGERRQEKEEKGVDYHRIERSVGSFSRSFTLPSNASSEGVEASFRDGILTIEIPKREETKPRQIAIK